MQQIPDVVPYSRSDKAIPTPMSPRQLSALPHVCWPTLTRYGVVVPSTSLGSQSAAGNKYSTRQTTRLDTDVGANVS